MTKDQKAKADVIGAATGWAAAFNAGKAKACSSFYAENAMMRPEPMEPVEGRPAIAAFWEGLIENGYKNVRYLDPQVEMLSETRARLSSPWCMNRARGMIHEELWDKVDGVWNIAKDHFEIMDQWELRTGPAEVVLVHGAWMGAWCWGHVIEALKASGITVTAIELPAHGSRAGEGDLPTTLDDYADAVVKVLKDRDRPVVLVGHSFGGIVVSRAAELAPEKVAALTYLTAFLVPNGASFLSASEGVETSDALNNLEFSEDKSTVGIKESALHDAVAHDVPAEAFMAAAPHLVAEPTGPLGSPLEISRARWGRVPRYYIECTEDRAIPIQVQRAMAQSVQIEQVFTLHSSHAAMFSKPGEVAEALDSIARAV